MATVLDADLLEEDEFCEYALFVREAGNPVANGFYICAGRFVDVLSAVVSLFLLHSSNAERGCIHCTFALYVQEEQPLYVQPLAGVTVWCQCPRHFSFVLTRPLDCRTTALPFTGMDIGDWSTMTLCCTSVRIQRRSWTVWP